MLPRYRLFSRRHDCMFDVLRLIFGGTESKPTVSAWYSDNGMQKCVTLTDKNSDKLQAWTGLYTDTGIPIYDGDILRYKHVGCENWNIGAVTCKAVDGYPAYDLEPPHPGSVFSECNGIQVALLNGTVEVVGNMHQHSHLLTLDPNEEEYFWQPTL